MFLTITKKNRYTPAYPGFTIKVGFKGIFIAWTGFPDEWQILSLYIPHDMNQISLNVIVSIVTVIDQLVVMAIYSQMINEANLLFVLT